MKLDDYAARLAQIMERPVSYFSELKRALREQSPHFAKLNAKLDKSIKARASALPDAKTLKGRAGPGGGVDADPFRAGFFTVAAMIDAPRAEVPYQTWTVWHLSQAGSKLSGWGDFTPIFATCALTGQHLFGEAFKAIISDQALAGRVNEVRVSAAAEYAEVVYDKDQVSRFQAQHAVDSKKRYYSVAVLAGGAVRLIAMVLQSGAE